MGLRSYISPRAWKERIQRWRRTIEVSRKPDKDDFSSAVKITGAGILGLGLLGFIMFLIWFFVSGLI